MRFGGGKGEGGEEGREGVGKFKIGWVSGFGVNQYKAVAITSVVLTSDAATSWGVFFNPHPPEFPTSQ